MNNCVSVQDFQDFTGSMKSVSCTPTSNFELLDQTDKEQRNMDACAPTTEPWSSAEDVVLLELVNEHGVAGCW